MDITEPYWRRINIGLGDGFAVRQQAITWANVDQIYVTLWRPKAIMDFNICTYVRCCALKKMTDQDFLSDNHGF